MGLFSFLKKPKQQDPVPVEVPVAAPKTPKNEKEKSFKVAGISFRTKDLMKLAVKNEDYSLSKKEIIDEELTDQNIYQYEFPVSKVELVPEPDNEYDQNAVKVVVDGVHIGYIKKGNCSQVKNLMAGDKIDHIGIWIGGGKYKNVMDDSGYDEKPNYSLETGENEFGAKVTVYLK